MEEIGNGKSQIIITEIPYQVNKKNLIESIAELAHSKRIDGLTDLRDESDRNGMRIVLELRRDVVPQILLNQLYKHTQLQDSYGIIMLALVNGEPKIPNLKQMLEEYIKHQIDVVTRRCQFDLKKAKDRLEIVEGLKIALDNIDEVIRIIKASRDNNIAKTALMDAFGFSERQAQHILEMQLRRLTGLEREKIEAEMAELQKTIAWLEEVLGDRNLLIGIIKEDLQRVGKNTATNAAPPSKPTPKSWTLKTSSLRKIWSLPSPTAAISNGWPPTIIAVRSEAAKV